MQRMLVLTVLFLASLIRIGMSTVTAQDETPNPLEISSFGGVTFSAMGFSAVMEMPPAPSIASIERATIVPGGVLLGVKEDPGFHLIAVESGQLTVKSLGGIRVTRGTDVAETIANYGGFPEQSVIASGEEVTLSPGDSVFFPPFGGGDLKNDGDTDVSLVYVIVAPADFGANE